MTLSTKKKLLILDVNGLLVQRFFQAEKLPEHRSPDGKLGKFYVYKRPYYKEFLTFCFEKFEVGLWSSAQQHNVQNLVDFVFGDLKSKLVLTWHQSDCLDTGLKNPDNSRKPVFLKELHKLWSKLNSDLPREGGYYGPFNTLLIDDTPYKAMCNPPHTAIFPDPYEVSDEPDDALGGALRKYLEGLAGATDVQDYVKYHPFGQLPFSKESPLWHSYCNILRSPTIIRNSSPIVKTNVKGVTNKLLPSITFNNGSTQRFSSQKCLVPSIEREDDGLAATSVSCLTKRSSTPVNSLTQKHVIFNGQEENGVAKVTNHRKKRRNSVMEPAFNQEHEAHNRSVVDKEPAFGMSQQSDLDVVSRDDGWPETAVTYTMERNGAIVSTLSQKHVSFNWLEENDVVEATNPRKKRSSVIEDALNQEHEAHNRSAVDKEAAFGISQQSDLDMVSRDDGRSETVGTCKTERVGAIITTSNKKHATSENKKVYSETDKYHVGNNTLKRSGRDFWDVRGSNRGHHYKSSNFNNDYRDWSNHRSSYNSYTNNGVSRTYHSPKQYDGNWWHHNDVNATLQTNVAQTGAYAQTNTGGSRTSRCSREFERFIVNPTIQTQVAQAGNYAQTRTGGSQTSRFQRTFERDWRHQNDANATLQTHVANTGTNAQANKGGNRTSYHPRKFKGNWRHQNDGKATLQTDVAQFSSLADKNAFGRRLVPENENLVGYPREGYTNGRHCQSWANQHSSFWGGSYSGHHQNHNHFYNPTLFSHSYYKANHMRQKSNDRKSHRSNDRF